MAAWHLASLIVGIVLLIIGGGALLAATIGMVLIPFLTISMGLVTGAVVFIVGIVVAGYSAWAWRTHRRQI
ncbi:MAG: hypothetical protein HYY22_02355 [Thaumarchaeota archaeon]|nr:hypothetical protein [Nitrososphaerota archaeon]